MKVNHRHLACKWAHIIQRTMRRKWRGRCKKAASVSKISRASLRPLISASRRALRSSYVSGFLMHFASSLARYSSTASNSVCFSPRSEDSSETVLSRLFASAALYLASCSFIVFVVLFSCVCLSYVDWASSSSMFACARFLEKSDSATSSIEMIEPPASPDAEWVEGGDGCCKSEADP